MRKVLRRAAALAILLAVAVPVSAQFGHPLKGTWSADWTPSAGKTSHVLVELNWDGKAVTGTINPGRSGVAVSKATLDASWNVHVEADGKDAAGQAVHFALDGKLENIGSMNRVIVGTWTEGSAKGPIKLVRN